MLPELFEQFVKEIFKLENISTDTIYIDGTKIEAYANRYTFAWKDSIEKYRLRLNRSIQIEEAFTVLKEDMKLRKLKVRRKTSVLREICLFCIGYNFNRYISRSLRNCKGTTFHSLKAA